MVSRKLVTFLLSELKTVRVICKHRGCGVVTEMPTNQLTVRFVGNQAACPHCRGILFHESPLHTVTPAVALAYLAAESVRADAMYDIEFVLPDMS